MTTQLPITNSLLHVLSDDQSNPIDTTDAREELSTLLSQRDALVEALEGVLSMLELLNAPGTHDPMEARVYAARAAIAKAKGETL